MQTHSLDQLTRPEDPSSEEEELYGQNIFVVMEADGKGSTKWITKSILYATQKYMSAKERNTEEIEEFLTQHLSVDVRGVVTFDNEEVVSLDNSLGSLPNCWSLSVVALSSIAVALPNVDPHSIDKLVEGVNEGLVLIKLIEDKFNNQPHFMVVKRAAYGVWTRSFGPRFKHTVGPTIQNGSPIEILKLIETTAKNDFHVDGADHHHKVVAHSMYRFCHTLLMEFENDNQLSSGRLFEKLRATIADILGACFTNLKYYIMTECFKSTSIEKMREAAPSILTFFGDTKKIMEIIETKEIPEMSREKMVFIDEWREHYRCQRQSP